MTKHLLVTADDFGLSPGVNRGVLQAHRQGIVTGTSLMVNMPFAGDAMRLAADAPTLAIGLHLNLTSGTPLTRARHLVDAHGQFLPLTRILAVLASWPGASQDVQVEWEAQAEAFLQLRPHAAALDSHHHLHVHPRLLNHALRLARELDVPMRWPRDQFQLRAGDWLDLKSSALGLLTALLRGRLRRHGVVSTDFFAGLHLMGPRFTVENVRRVIERLRSGSTELMCHPGQVDEELRLSTSYAAPRAGELNALISPQLRDTIDSRGVRLASWIDLKEAVA